MRLIFYKTYSLLIVNCNVVSCADKVNKNHDEGDTYEMSILRNVLLRVENEYEP